MYFHPEISSRIRVILLQSLVPETFGYHPEICGKSIRKFQETFHQCHLVKCLEILKNRYQQLNGRQRCVGSTKKQSSRNTPHDQLCILPQRLTSAEARARRNTLFKTTQGAGEMTQKTKALATNPGPLSSNLKPHMVKGVVSHKLSSDHHMCKLPLPQHTSTNNV